MVVIEIIKTVLQDDMGTRCYLTRILISSASGATEAYIRWTQTDGDEDVHLLGDNQ